MLLPYCCSVTTVTALVENLAMYCQAVFAQHATGVSVCLKGRAKDARQARQLAEATGANLSSHGRVSAQYKRDNVKPGNTLCWSVVK